jgi:membrane protease YdiL (CAAX protease family)
MLNLTLGYLFLCLAAEIAGARGMLLPSALLHAVLILAVFGWYGVKYRRSMPRLPFGLGLVSLMRFFSLVLPLGLLAPVARYAVVAMPLLAAMWLLKQRLGLPAESLGLRLAQAPIQAWIALSGIPLGLAGYWILRPEPLMPDAGAGALAVGVLVLLGVALTEELLFRGFLLSFAMQELGYAGVWLSSLVFAAVYVSSGSMGFAGFMGLVGWVFSECAWRTGSIWGVILAHALLITGMGLVWPLIFPLI